MAVVLTILKGRPEGGAGSFQCTYDPMSNTLHNCRWVIQIASVGIDPTYCEAPVGFTLVQDDDGRKVRKYKTWCAEHEVKAQQQDTEELEGLEASEQIEEPQMSTKIKSKKIPKIKTPYVLLYWDCFGASDSKLFLIPSTEDAAKAAVRCHNVFENSAEAPEDHVIHRFSDALYAGKFDKWEQKLPCQITESVTFVRSGFIPDFPS